MAFLLVALRGVTERTLINLAGEKGILASMETLRQEKAIPDMEALQTCLVENLFSDEAESSMETGIDDALPDRREEPAILPSGLSVRE